MALEVSNRRLLSLFAFLTAVLLGASSAGLGVCGPFTDVAADAFCPFVLEIFTLGITTGTTPTTYDPASGVSRLQMAAFLSRSVDGVLRRGSRRATADKFYTPQGASVLGVTTVGDRAEVLRFDGGDLWVPTPGKVSRVRASDGRLFETWTGAVGASGVVVAMGRVLVTGDNNPGRLYSIDPRQAAGVVTTVVSGLPAAPRGIAFDGAKIWMANTFGSTVSMITPGATIPWAFSNVNITVGTSSPIGVVFDGANIWVTDADAKTLVKLDSSGSVLQTVPVCVAPYYPVFDGTNIWVPCLADAVTVVRASTGAVLQTLTGNGLSFSQSAAFDGERIIVTNAGGNSVSLWKAADLTPLGSFGTGTDSFPHGVTSDGLNFWISLGTTLARF